MKMPSTPRALTLAALALCCALGATAPAAASTVNLINNGDFEAGLSGFGTDYRISATGCIGCVAVAPTTIGWYNAPGFVHLFGDHTSGSGLMLQYDPPAAATGTARIWHQLVEVVAGTTYHFSGWLREANSEPTPNNGRVGVYAGGVLLGVQDAPDDHWLQWNFAYTASTSGSIELALRDLYPTTFFGTYSAIDDLRFAALESTGTPPTAVAEPASAALAALGLLLSALLGGSALRSGQARPVRAAATRGPVSSRV